MRALLHEIPACAGMTPTLFFANTLAITIPSFAIPAQARISNAMGGTANA